MKKLAFLLFAAGLFVISFTNTNCKRASNDVTLINNGDTQNHQTTIDSTGEDMNVVIYQDNITTGAAQINTGTLQGPAVVYLFNNWNDYQTYSSTGAHTSKYIDSIRIPEGASACQFKRVKPASSFAHPDYFTTGPNAGKAYTYYLAAVWYTTTGKPWKGWYTLKGDNTQADQIDVAINNGINKSGVPFPMSVSLH